MQVTIRSKGEMVGASFNASRLANNAFWRSTGRARRIDIAVLGPGDLCGEATLDSGEHCRHAHAAVASSALVVLSVERRVLKRLLHPHDSAALRAHFESRSAERVSRMEAALTAGSRVSVMGVHPHGTSAFHAASAAVGVSSSLIASAGPIGEYGLLEVDPSGEPTPAASFLGRGRTGSETAVRHTRMTGRGLTESGTAEGGRLGVPAKGEWLCQCRPCLWRLISACRVQAGKLLRCQAGRGTL